MIIKFSTKFKKQYKSLPTKTQKQFDSRLFLWQEDPANPLLHAHRLKGSLSNFYSINLTGDVRVLYEPAGGNVFVFHMIGMHAELYVK
jgi:mRNA-degrading endonuclease RelE of RelBE toxin-antitoxin system